MSREKTVDNVDHSFRVPVACEVGVNAAIILSHFAHFIGGKIENDRDYHDGHYWTYESAKALLARYPYMSDKKIRTALKALEDAGYILVGNYNKLPFDRTKWYALTDKGLAAMGLTAKIELVNEKRKESDESGEGGTICPIGQIDVPQRANENCPGGQMRFAPEGEPIPSSVPSSSPRSVHPRSVGESVCSLLADTHSAEREEVNTRENAKTDYEFSAPDPFADPRTDGPGPEWRRPCEPPTVDEVREYAAVIGYPDLDAEKFCNHYASVGWMKGRTPITDWKALVRMWRLGDRSRAAEKEAERKAQEAARPYGADNMPPVPPLSSMDRDAAWDFMNLTGEGRLYATKLQFAVGEQKARKRWVDAVYAEWDRAVEKAREEGLRPRLNSIDNGRPKWQSIEG